MMRALSSGVAGLKAHQTAMDVVGNNIANVNTPGFKASRTLFRDALYQTISAASGANDTEGTAGINPSQIGYGATASSVDVDTGRSGYSATGIATDCYIDGEGYFTVADGAPASTSATTPPSYKYTRVGSLGFDTEGYLTDGNGNRVCGVCNTAPKSLETGTVAAITTSTVPAYIYYDPTKTTLKDIAISSDGTVTATDSNKKVVTVGKIALAHFQNAAGLTQEGESYYKVSDNSGSATYASPGSSSTGSLKTSGLESSNVDLANEFSNMITYERGFQANSKIMTVADEMLETLVNLKR